jgi:hypothetical protein
MDRSESFFGCAKLLSLGTGERLYFFSSQNSLLVYFVLKTAKLHLRFSRKWHENDENKNRSGQFLSGFVSGQVGQESNLQPAVLEFTC